MSLLEVLGDKYLNILCKKIINYDGQDLPLIINEILFENKGKVLFGGSSLIHDLYFKKADWDRDYDIWCDKDTYKKIKINFYRNSKFRKIKEEAFDRNSNNLYYGNFQAQGIAEFFYDIDDFQKIKIQLIDIGSSYLMYNILKSVDFTFNTIFYDGEKLIFHDTTEEEIQLKKGRIRNKFSNRFSTIISMNSKESEFSEKELQRVRKYQKRGFEITNLCPFCDFKYPISINHCFSCLSKKLSIKTYHDLFKMGRFITEDKLGKVMEECLMHNDECIIYTMLIFIISTKNIIIFQTQFENHRHLYDPYSIHYYLLICFFLENGLYIPFVSFFELALPHLSEYSNAKIYEFFSMICRKNFKNLAIYFTEKIPRCRLEIFEDKIISYKCLNIFEHYMEVKDINIITQYFRYITQCNDPVEDGETCAICHTEFPNLKLSCRHRYCADCLITYFSIEYKKKGLSCPLCRIKF